MLTLDTPDLQARVARALQDFWEDYAGVRPNRVRVVTDRQAIAVWLEEVLSPAELQLAGTGVGRVTLREFNERVLELARPQLQQVVEDAVGQEVVLVEVHLDVQTGNVLGFFLLE